MISIIYIALGIWLLYGFFQVLLGILQIIFGCLMMTAGAMIWTIGTIRAAFDRQ